VAQTAPVGGRNESNFVDLRGSAASQGDAEAPRHGLEPFLPFFGNPPGSSRDFDSA
jgi:hypothetical protein